MSEVAYPWSHTSPLPAHLAPLFRVDWSEHRRKRGRGKGKFSPIVLSGTLDSPARAKPIVRRRAAI